MFSIDSAETGEEGSNDLMFSRLNSMETARPICLVVSR